jgi:hypothetical protein
MDIFLDANDSDSSTDNEDILNNKTKSEKLKTADDSIPKPLQTEGEGGGGVDREKSVSPLEGSPVNAPRKKMNEIAPAFIKC